VRYSRLILFAGAALWTHPALAADALKFGAPPAWVVPQAIPPASDKVKDKPLAILLHDQQTMLEPGKISVYSELAYKIQKPEGLVAGNLSVAWNPAFDTPTVNRLEIRRGSQVIDVLKSGQTFTTMRRESNLELATLDGVLTANIQPEGLQEGDVIVLATTIEHSDPTLKGHVEITFAPWGQAQIGLAHALVAWPSSVDLKFQKVGDLPVPVQSARDGRKIYELTMRDSEPVIPPKGAPLRFKIGRVAEASDFRSWADAARLMEPLYRAAAVIPASGPLRDEVEKIRKASADPKVRAEQALALVQDRTRYVALAMAQGGLVPAPAETTWSRRFGDCKAKTALLLAMLHEYGISAEPVLVNAFAGDAVGEWLPMIGAFDHVLVRAHIGGKDYWLDGTRTGDTELDAIEVPNFGWGLPLVANAQLVRMVPAPRALPNFERHVSIDATAGVYTPAAVTINELHRGDMAIEYSASYSAMTADQRDQQMHDEAKTYFDSFTVASSSFQFDKAKREFHITIKGTAKLNWRDSWLDVPTSSIAYDPDFDRTAGPLHDAPWAVDYRNFVKDEATIKLPPGFAAEQKLSPPVHETLAGIEYARSETVEGNIMTVDSSQRGVAQEVSYKEALAAAARLKALSDNDVYLRVGQAYKPTQQDLAALKGEKPQTASEYFTRAYAELLHNGQDDALGDLNDGIVLEPKNAWALKKRAWIYISTQHFAEAEADLQAANLIDPTDSEVAVTRGQLALAKGDIGLASAAFDQALRENPQSSAAHNGRATIFVQQGKDDEALSELTTALSTDPRNASAFALRAEILNSRNDRQAADKDIGTALAEEPDNATVLAAKAWIAVERKDYATAKKFVSDTLAHDRNNSIARNLQAALAKREGNEALALESFDTAVAIAPRDAAALLNRASAYIDAKKFDAAERDVASALVLEPKNLRARRTLGAIAVAKGDYSGAVEALTAALIAAPSDSSILQARAEAYQKLHKFDLALTDTDAAIKLGLVSPSLRLLRINILVGKGNVSAVARETDQLLTENPTSDFALVIAGKTYAAIGMRDKAMASFARALAIRPYSYIYLNRADVRSFSDVQGKLADIDAALKLEPDKEEALAAKAHLLSRTGNHAEAIQLYDRAISVSLDGSNLELDRAIALQKAGRLQEAKAGFLAAYQTAKTAGDFDRICFAKAADNVLLESALEDCRHAFRLDPKYPALPESLGLALLKLGKLQDALADLNKAVDENSGAEAYLIRAIVRSRLGDHAGAREDATEAHRLRADVDDRVANYGLKFNDPSRAAKGTDSY
jgi:tetratricopeptide (TPR) repeat protein